MSTSVTLYVLHFGNFPLEISGHYFKPNFGFAPPFPFPKSPHSSMISKFSGGRSIYQNEYYSLRFLFLSFCLFCKFLLKNTIQ